MLTRLIAATVMSTASLIALSAQASVCADCICSAISCMRRWKSGSLKKPPKPSMGSTVLVAELALGASGARRPRDLLLAAVLGLPLGDGAPERGEGDRAGRDRQPEGEEAVRQDGDDRRRGIDPEGDEGADHAAVHAADAAREREQVRERADEVAEDEHADRG